MVDVVDTWLAEGAILATLHFPEQGSDAGVVVCAPIGQDYTVAYRTLRHLADSVARGGAAGAGAGGLAVVRYDHPGFGDSTVPLADDSLEQGARLAAAALRRAGVTRVVYLGLGSGALVASAAAAADPDAAGLVLWDPAASGRQWLRRQRSLYTMAVDQVAEPTPDGLVEIAGAEFPASFAVHISGLDYSAEPVGRMPVLVARRSGASGTVPKSLRPVEGRLAVVEVPGHEAALDVSSVLATIPAESVRLVTRWLVDTFGGTTKNLEVPASTGEALVVENGVVLTESLVRIGQHDLFAVETRPADADSSIPGVVLHNGSAEHRVGTTRHQVLLARKMASRGMRVLRVDRRGTGETGVVSPHEQSLLYTQQWVEDGEDAVAYLKLPREKVGVVGMCVGAWIGLVAKPEATRFIAALSLNDHRVNTVGPGVQVARDTSEPATVSWMRHAVNRSIAFAKDHLPYQAAVSLASRGVIQFAEPNLRRALSAGTNVSLFLAPEDTRIFDAHGGRRAADRLAAAPGRLTVAEQATGDHALYSPGIRAEAIDWSVEQAASEFGLVAAPAS